MEVDRRVGDIAQCSDQRSCRWGPYQTSHILDRKNLALGLLKIARYAGIIVQRIFRMRRIEQVARVADCAPGDLALHHCCLAVEFFMASQHPHHLLR